MHRIAREIVALRSQSCRLSAKLSLIGVVYADAKPGFSLHKDEREKDRSEAVGSSAKN